jgi:hypothetical protein
MLTAVERLMRVLEFAALAILLVALAYGFRAQLREALADGTSYVRTEFVERTGDVGPTPVVPSATETRTASIAGTGGIGVAVRNACSDDARVAVAGIPEGAQVRVLEAGGANCSGWQLVEWEQHRSWVRDGYILTSGRE